MASSNSSSSKGTSRRDFIRNSSLLVAGGAMAAGSLNIARAAHSFGSDEIKIGLVGCGGRGTGAVVDAVTAAEGTYPIKLVAMADVFQSQLDKSYEAISEQFKDKPGVIDVPTDKRFIGFDAYKKALAVSEKKDKELAKKLSSKLASIEKERVPTNSEDK